MKNNIHHRNFASISTNDGQYRVWFSSPSDQGQQVITCSFSLVDKQTFLDSLNSLKYMHVDCVREIGANMSHIYLHTTIDRKECMLQLFEDLPSILEDSLGNKAIEL